MDRNAAELRAAAIATGWYDGPNLHYQGDGASVPWEVALPISLPAGLTLWMYKAYLDARWPEPFRLHDWLYTPYGAMIGVTRLEADNALQEEIGRDSAIDAAIVYAAVRAGGGPYFGVSQTGYVQPALPGGGRNIVKTPQGTRIGGFNPMATKVVLVFQMTTQAGGSDPSLGLAGRSHVGGWSESFYAQFDAATTASFLRTGGGVQPPAAQSRAALLPSIAVLLGARLYEGGRGRGQFIGFGFNGIWSQADIPQMALLCRARDTTANVSRRFTIRAIPDNQVVGGEFAPEIAYRIALRQYFDSLGGFQFKALNPTSTLYPIFSIGSTGVVALTVNNPFSVGDIITILSTLDASGTRRGGKFRVTAVGPTAQEFTIANWPHGACTGGTATLPTTQLFNMSPSGFEAVRILTRRVGRPFELYRGRRSRRKAKV